MAVRLTNQRIEILIYLKGNFTHPTAEEVYLGVRKKLPRISRATVYQNLKFLSDKGFILEVDVKGVSRFEPVIGPHHHLICRVCGKIMDFESKELTDYAMKIVKKINDFDIKSTNSNFYGECKKRCGGK